jgi:hypothetical protein
MALNLRLAAIAFILLQSQSALGQPIPIFPGNPLPSEFHNSHANGGVWGWSFYVRQPVNVTHVGWYDEGGDGLSHSHQVGLWQDLTGATTWPYIGDTARELFRRYDDRIEFPSRLDIPAGTQAELVGHWRTVAIPGGPIPLAPGGYAVGGIDYSGSTDGLRYIQLGDEEPPLSSNVKVVFGAPGGSEGFGFGPPANFLLVRGIETGPMLFLEVPEPAGVWLSGLALLAGRFIMRGRRAPNRSAQIAYLLEP